MSPDVMPVIFKAMSVLQEISMVHGADTFRFPFYFDGAFGGGALVSGKRWREQHVGGRETFSVDRRAV